MLQLALVHPQPNKHTAQLECMIPIIRADRHPVCNSNVLVQSPSHDTQSITASMVGSTDIAKTGSSNSAIFRPIEPNEPGFLGNPPSFQLMEELYVG